METNAIYNKIAELEREIARLPEGSITGKKVNGHIYYYHRITRDGKRKEIYLQAGKADELKVRIAQRKLLEKQLKTLKESLSQENPRNITSSGTEPEEFRTYIRRGKALENFIAIVRDYQRRDCFEPLNAALRDESSEKVLILYGLRRTGKTTLIRQLITNMSEEEKQRSVYIQIKSSDTLSDVNADLKRLEAQGYRYIFIDEVTLMQDFIEGAALFSDIFAASGMKIVLSGTDSLGFLFSEDEQLFDRCKLFHTTWIQYCEFERVLGIRGIDEYIRYGGTMSLSGTLYNADSVFATPQKTNEYIDSAIAKNIQHSLSFYQDGGHFRALRELYDQNELTNAINRVVEDMNHRFTVETLTRTFASNDLAISARNLRRDRQNPTDILESIDRDAVTHALKTALEILDKEEQRVSVNETHAAQIQEYLKLLDLVVDIPIQQIPHNPQKSVLSVITQPGLRYVQAEALVQSLIQDSALEVLDLTQKSSLLERIRNEIRGRMMEEIVLLETTFGCPQKQVFKLQFAVGEFDMVVCDPLSLSCSIYEIKHSKERAAAQYRHLVDDEKCTLTEHYFGKIIGKYVIYRGSPAIENGIEYLNVEAYLKSIRK